MQLYRSLTLRFGRSSIFRPSHITYLTISYRHLLSTHTPPQLLGHKGTPMLSLLLLITQRNGQKVVLMVSLLASVVWFITDNFQDILLRTFVLFSTLYLHHLYLAGLKFKKIKWLTAFSYMFVDTISYPSHTQAYLQSRAFTQNQCCRFMLSREQSEQMTRKLEILFHLNKFGLLQTLHHGLVPQLIDGSLKRQVSHSAPNFGSINTLIKNFFTHYRWVRYFIII